MLNFFSAIYVVSVNKMVTNQYGFHFATILTCFQLTCTLLLSIRTSKAGVFEIKKLPIVQVAKLAVLYAAFVFTSNLSLNYNSVGFYTVMKMMVVPTIVAIESVFHKKISERV